ncbi:MAG: DUF3825 domain-containing protein [Verrucomicrobia bacterium]|nr:DUF3825 domain-containing protein [Verrucomicrobiota bacterium]
MVIWEYRSSKQSTRSNPILFNYLVYTFSRIQEENKIAVAQGDTKACFNTGLVTPNQEQLFALFVPNANPNQQPWFLREFCRESDRQLRDFDQLPPLASFFTEPI